MAANHQEMKTELTSELKSEFTSELTPTHTSGFLEFTAESNGNLGNENSSESTGSEHLSESPVNDEAVESPANEAVENPVTEDTLERIVTETSSDSQGGEISAESTGSENSSENSDDNSGSDNSDIECATEKEFKIRKMTLNANERLLMLTKSLGKKNSALEKLTVVVGEPNDNFINSEFSPAAFFQTLLDVNCNLKTLVLKCRSIKMDKNGIESIISFFEKSRVETFELSCSRAQIDTHCFKGGIDDAFDYLLSQIIEKSKSLKSLTFNRPIIVEQGYERHHIEKADRLIAALKTNKTLEQFSLGENSVSVDFYEFLQQNNTLQTLRALIKGHNSPQVLKKLYELIYTNTGIQDADYMFEPMRGSQLLIDIGNVFDRNAMEPKVVAEFQHQIREILSAFTNLNNREGVLQLVTSYLEDDKPFDEIFPRVTFLYENSKMEYNEAVCNEKVALGRSIMKARAAHSV